MESEPTQKAGCVILSESGAVLLVHNFRRDSWGIPKGHKEEGETLEECAIRETYEETGWEVQILGLLDMIHYQHPKTDEEIEVYCFLAKALAQSGVGVELHEWTPLELAQTLVKPDTANVLRQALPH